MQRDATPVYGDTDEHEVCSMFDFAGVDLSYGSFQQLARLCHDDPAFPLTEDAWDALVARDTASFTRRGESPGTVHIDPDRFEHWCDGLELRPCVDALRAYCIIHRLPRGHHRYGSMPLDSDLGALGP